jgi:hypothetical protein
MRAARVGVAFVEAAFDVLEDRDVGERGAGEVDVQRDRLSCPLALGQQLQGPADDPAVELLDHPGALRGLDERRRRQQLAVAAGHPQQQLVALDPARGEAAGRRRPARPRRR